MPGTKIPVIEENKIRKYNPDYLYLSSWHIKDSLIKIFKKMDTRANLLFSFNT